MTAGTIATANNEILEHVKQPMKIEEKLGLSLITNFNFIYFLNLCSIQIVKLHERFQQLYNCLAKLGKSIIEKLKVEIVIYLS